MRNIGMCWIECTLTRGGKTLINLCNIVDIENMGTHCKLYGPNSAFCAVTDSYETIRAAIVAFGEKKTTGKKE